MFVELHTNDVFQQMVASVCLMLIQIHEYKINRAIPHLTHHKLVVYIVFNYVFS